jgi:hypothetical protein
MNVEKQKLTKRDLASIVLLNGSHPSRAEGVCAMEAVAWLAGEKHSDAPICTCPIIANMVRRFNDRINDDAERTRLLAPILPLLVGTRSTTDVMIKRGYAAADFAVRVVAPIALEARGRKVDADKLRALDPIIDRATALKAQKTDAAYAADAAAYAAYAAAAAAAAAAADAAAAAAADAAAAAADAAAAAARTTLYELTIDCIKKMCAIQS